MYSELEELGRKVESLKSAAALGSSGTLAFGGGTLQYSSSNTTDHSGRFSTAASQAYKVDTNSQAVTWATALTSSGGSLVKSGAGTLTLSGSNTYSGTTAVSAGTLVVDGNQSAATGAVAVSGTLAGTGTLGGAITINSGGTLAPGDVGAVGTLNQSSSLHFASGSVFEWSMNENQVGTAFDMVGGAGATIVDTGSEVFKIVFGPAVNMSDSFWSAPWVTHQWAMSAIFTGGFSGAFTSVDTGSYPVNSLGSFSINGSYLTYTTVPEPTSALVGVLLAAGLLRRKRD